MELSAKILLLFGIICLILGSFVFMGHDMWGIMVDMVQGLLYVACGLFAFAAVMRGGRSIRRFSLTAGLVFSSVFLTGIISRQSVLELFRINVWENMIHLLFAVSLLTLSVAEHQLAQWFAPARRI